MPNAANIQPRGVARPKAAAGSGSAVIVTVLRDVVLAITPGQALDLATELANAYEEVTAR